MQRLVSYLAAAAASVLGWKLGAMAGPAWAYFLAVFAAAGAMYATRRWLRSALG
jgi:hypothetical protein